MYDDDDDDDDINHVTIQSLVDLCAKNKDMTLRESDYLTAVVCKFKFVDRVKRADGSSVKLSQDQRSFVAKLLGDCIQKQTPKLQEILTVFDLNLSDTLCFIQIQMSYKGCLFD